MKVRAKRMGYLGLVRRREGSEFELPAGVKFSESWMERVDGKSEKSSVKTEEPKAQKATGDAEVI